MIAEIPYCLCDTTQIWVVLILRRHLAGKPVVVLQNILVLFSQVRGDFPRALIYKYFPLNTCN